MLRGDCKKGSPGKGALAAQPLIDHHCQRVLVTGQAWVAPNLLRRNIANRADNLLSGNRECPWGHNSYAKIRKQHLVASAEQHILRLDIAMNHLAFMGVLQGCCNLIDILHYSKQGESCSFGMALAQCPIRSVVENEKRS